MRLEMQKVPDKDEVQITIYAEPITILGIEGSIVECEWENRRWKMYLPGWYASVLDEEFDESMQHAFLTRVNSLLASIGEEE